MLWYLLSVGRTVCVFVLIFLIGAFSAFILSYSGYRNSFDHELAPFTLIGANTSMSRAYALSNK